MSEASDKYENYEIMFATYGDEEGAGRAVEALKKLDDAKAIDIIDAATLVKDAEGKVSVTQESLPNVKKGLGIGALIGGAIGLLFPPSILAAAAVGADIGAGSAQLAKMALENDDLKAAAESLEPGTSAFIAVVENTWVSRLQDIIAGYENLALQTVDAEAAGVIGTLVNESETLTYGGVSSAEGAARFASATDGETAVGAVTAATVDDEGNPIVAQVSGVVATDEDGNVGAIAREVVATVDEEGNAVAADNIVAGYVPAGEAEAEDTDES